MALTARISPTTDHIIHELVEITGKSKVIIIEEAIQSYFFQERMNRLNNEYLKLQSKKNDWGAELKEREELEGTLLDGLDEY